QIIWAPFAAASRICSIALFRLVALSATQLICTVPIFTLVIIIPLSMQRYDLLVQQKRRLVSQFVSGYFIFQERRYHNEVLAGYETDVCCIRFVGLRIQ